MKWLLRLLTSLRPPFEKGGRLHLMKPVFDANENFFFGPEARTSDEPHIRDPLDVKRYMTMVIVALAPCVAMSVYYFGLRVLAMILVSYAVGGAVEVVFAVLRKEDINEGFLVTGLIFPLILPPALPLWLVGVGVAFGVLVGKELFGGTGRNLFNPALVGRCMLLIGYARAMSSNWIIPGGGMKGRLFQWVDGCSVDAITKSTPLVVAKQVAETLKEDPLAVVAEPVSPLIDLMTGQVAGSVGETSAIAVVVGGLFLLLTRVANWRTVLGALGSFSLLGLILNLAMPGDFGPVGWNLCAGGLLFGVFFMATDPVTSPVTNTGKIIYGIIIGTSTLLIRNLTGYVEGVMFAILLGNICAPLLDEIVFRFRFRRLQHER